MTYHLEGTPFAGLEVTYAREVHMRVQEVMTRDPSCVTSDTPAREAAQIMKNEDVGVVPVVDGDNTRRLVGVVTDRDIALRIVGEGRDGNTPVSEIMSGNRLATSTPDEDLDDVMDKMASEKVRRIPVVDERGSLVGIVSQADVARKAHDDSKAGRTVERISEPGGSHSQT
jgi:CBS domain-containing protein